MPSPDTHAPITWHLRRLMASAGMFQTTDLVEPLREAGVHLSREQVFRLVTKPPARLNMEILAALCTILSCSPADLIEINPPVAVTGSTRTGTGGASTTGTTGPSIGSLRPIPARIHRPTSD